MKIFLFIILKICCFYFATAPPVYKKKLKVLFENEIDHLGWTNKAEFKYYLTKVLSQYKSDDDFQKRLEKVKDQNNSASVADQKELSLPNSSHFFRAKFDEIRRREIMHRLNSPKSQLKHVKGNQNLETHVYHSNRDRKKRIDKVSSDLTTVKQKRENELKRREIEKQEESKQEMSKIKDMKWGEEEIHRFEKSKRRHTKHEEMSHPGSEEHFSDIWEDYLDRDSFDMETLFLQHDKDKNGYLDEVEMDNLMMRKLDKSYEKKKLDNGIVDRSEVMKLWQEIMRKSDINDDRMISYDEFVNWTKATKHMEELLDFPSSNNEEYPLLLFL